MNSLTERSTRLAPLTDYEFERIRSLARTGFGINLQPSKKAMVSSRLERVLRKGNWSSYAKYLDILGSRTSGPEWTEFVDSLTTNHTWFFREAEHFTFLQREVFPKVNGRLRIWSAACATGEEPYSLAMLAAECNVQDVEILATDISQTALAQAARGIYEASRLTGLEPAMRDRYLVPVAQAGHQAFSISDRIRKNIRFQSANLLNVLDHFGRFHVILCRNVMIYFDREVQDALVSRLIDRLQPDGLFFTGHSESLLQLPPSLQYVKPAIYRKVS